jgi:hypothetical protein
VRISFGGFSTEEINVGKDGIVKLPQPFTTNSARIDFIKTVAPDGAAAYRLIPAIGFKEIQVTGLRPPAIRKRGKFSTPCGELSVRSGDSMLAARVTATVAQLDAARPMQITSCGKKNQLSLSGGPNAISAPPGPMMRIDHLELASRPPLAPLRSRSKASVISAKPDAQGFTEVHYTGPGWLVRAESFSLGWTATCGPTQDDQRPLGAPRLIDGFASGWAVDRWCRFAKFTFAPQASANSAYLASAGATGLFALVLIGGLFTTRRRRLAGAPDPIQPHLPIAPGDDRLAYARRQFAATSPLAAGALAAGLFALRVGPPVALIALFLGLWGVNVRRLYRLAAAALLLVPIGYVAMTPKNRGGGNFYYAVEQILTHWVATVAILLAASGAALTALRIRWSTHPRAGRWSLRRVRAEIRGRRISRRDARG